MKAQIFVNRHKVRENKKHGIDPPCIGIRLPKQGFKPDPPEMAPMPKSDTHEVWVSFEGTAKVFVTADTDEAAITEACDNVLARGKVKTLEITHSEAHRLREA